MIAIIMSAAVLFAGFIIDSYSLEPIMTRPVYFIVASFWMIAAVIAGELIELNGYCARREPERNGKNQQRET
jgi:hypothetical protein